MSRNIPCIKIVMRIIYKILFIQKRKPAIVFELLVIMKKPTKVSGIRHQKPSIYFENPSPTLSATLTFIVSPFTKFPASSSCDNGFTRYF